MVLYRERKTIRKKKKKTYACVCTVGGVGPEQGAGARGEREEEASGPRRRRPRGRRRSPRGPAAPAGERPATSFFPSFPLRLLLFPLVSRLNFFSLLFSKFFDDFSNFFPHGTWCMCTSFSTLAPLHRILALRSTQFAGSCGAFRRLVLRLPLSLLSPHVACTHAHSTAMSNATKWVALPSVEFPNFGCSGRRVGEFRVRCP